MTGVAPETPSVGVPVPASDAGPTSGVGRTNARVSRPMRPPMRCRRALAGVAATVRHTLGAWHVTGLGRRRLDTRPPDTGPADRVGAE